MEPKLHVSQTVLPSTYSASTWRI